MRTFRLALLAASAAFAAMPALVHAQDQGHQDHGGDHGGENHRGGPAGGDHHGGGDRAGIGGPGNGGRPGPAAAPAGHNASDADRARPDMHRDEGRHEVDHHDDGHRNDGRYNNGRPGVPGTRSGGAQGGSGVDPARGRGDDYRGRPGRGPGFDTDGGRFDHGARDGRDDRYRGDVRYRGDNGYQGGNRYDWRGYRDAHRDLFHGARYRAPRGYGYGYRALSRGYRLPPFFYARDYWIDDPYAYRLPPAEGPYRWVRYYDDVLLVDLRSGVVVDVIRDFFL